MKGVDAEVDRVLDLAEAVCDDAASSAECAELDSLVLADETVRRNYWDYCQMHVMLEMDLRLNRALKKVHAQDRFDTADLTPWESDALAGVTSSVMPSNSSTVFGLFSGTLHGTIGFFSQEVPFALLIATVITGLGLLMGSFVYVSHHEQIADTKLPPSLPSQAAIRSQAEYVGRITGMVDVKWSDATTVAVTELVALGRRYALASGLMEITYDTGAKVILQGPVTYEVDSREGGFLSIGKLTAKLEKRGERRKERGEGIAKNKSERSTIHDPLFTIKTPTATVTDLGTEFGVEVVKGGVTTSHVFRGSVEVRPINAAGRAEGDAQVLHENQSAQIKKRNGNHGGHCITVFTPSAQPADYVREMPKLIVKTLDLVDVVAGGDGFGKARNRGIHPNTGEIVDRSPADPNWERIRSDNHYHKVKGLSLIDGVFAPDDRQGSVQLDSAGHTFTGFGNSDNRVFGPIWAGGELPAPNNSPTRTELGGIDYASLGHGVLGMVSNKGITFDLAAIRKANPSSTRMRFRAVVGNVSSYDNTSNAIPGMRTDAWVFVDGTVRWRIQTNGFVSYPIDIAIGSSDRFLALVVTDGGDLLDGDRIIIGDPRLELTVSDGTKPSIRKAAK